MLSAVNISRFLSSYHMPAHFSAVSEFCRSQLSVKSAQHFSTVNLVPRTFTQASMQAWVKVLGTRLLYRQLKFWPLYHFIWASSLKEFLKMMNWKWHSSPVDVMVIREYRIWVTSRNHCQCSFPQITLGNLFPARVGGYFLIRSLITLRSKRSRSKSFLAFWPRVKSFERLRVN